jgi:hypothetical protein
MMGVGKVGMGVTRATVLVPMRMNSEHRFTGPVVIVVRIVLVRVRVLERLMLVFMGMLFGNVQPDTDQHESAGHGEPPGERLVQEHDR